MQNHPQRDIDHWLEFAHGCAVAAGEAILPHFRAAIDVEDKGSPGRYDPVTVADRAAESVIQQRITQTYPTHGIRGEEHGWRKGQSNLTWVIDPIDGTRSFIVGQLHWGTLIALHDGERVVVGVAHNPFVNESFVAAANGPAQWRRGSERRLLRTRRCTTLGDAVLACTDPKMFSAPASLAAFNRVADAVRFTRYGADCYAYCLLAMGFIDVVVESSLQAYDVQALIPIVESAGGVMTDWAGNYCDEGGDVVACGDKTLHAQVLERLEHS